MAPIDPTSSDDSLVSVIIPCFAQAQFLPSAIESVLSQTHAAFEIVVIDDGSPDNTYEVASRYGEVRCIRQRNSGLALARNRGLEESKGAYVVFLDADDRLLPHALTAGTNALAAYPECAFVWGFSRPIDAHGHVLGGITNPIDVPPSYEALLERNIVGPPVGVMFRRQPLLAAGGFAPFPSACEDYELYLRLARTLGFRCHGELVAEYRYHDSKMSSDADRMLKAMLHVLDGEAAWVGDRLPLRAALAKGRKHAITTYAVAPRVEEIADRVRLRQLAKATGLAVRTLLEHPDKFIPLVYRRIRDRVWTRGSAAE